jgi:hypothetical protein
MRDKARRLVPITSKMVKTTNELLKVGVSKGMSNLYIAKSGEVETFALLWNTSQHLL